MPLPPLGSFGALGGGSLQMCFGNKFFLICFLQLRWKGGLLQTSSGTFGLPEPETPLALPGDQPLAVTRELLPTPTHSGGKQSLSELATARPLPLLPSLRCLDLNLGRLVGRGLPYGSVTPRSLQGLLCTVTLSSPRKHLGAPIFPHGIPPSTWPCLGSAAFLQHSLPPVPPCRWEEPMCPLPSPSSLSAFPRLHLRAEKGLRAAQLLATTSVRPGPSQGSARVGRGTPSTAHIHQPRPALMLRGTWRSPFPPKNQGAAQTARGERDQRAGPAAPLLRGGHGGRGRCRQEHLGPWGEPQPR